MLNQPPLLSIILPIFNGDAYIIDAIRSVQAQAISDWELICVDDGSTDQSVRRIESLNESRLRIIQQTNQGPAAARNRGIEASTGTYIAFIDADDLWPAQKIEQQLAVFQRNTNVDAVIGMVQYFFAEQVEQPAYRFTHDQNRVFYYQLGAGLFHRSVFERIGLFNESLRHSEDVDWYMRLKEQSISLQTLEQTTLLYRIHGQNMTTGYDVTNNNLFQVLHNSLNRRRQEGTVHSLRNFSEY